MAGPLSLESAMATRNAILQRSNALGEVGRSVAPRSVGDGVRPATFEAAMNQALLDSAAARETNFRAGIDRGASVAPVEQSSIASTIKDAVNKVSSLDEQEDAAAEAYERGETTDIATVMLIGERSSIAFEATLQVRNKVLSAYKDIMNMQI